MADEKLQRNKELFVRFLNGESYGQLGKAYGISSSRANGIVRHMIFDIWMHRNKDLPFNRISPTVADMRINKAMLMAAIAEMTANVQYTPW